MLNGGTYIKSTDKVNDVLKSILYDSTYPWSDYTIGEWYSINDVNAFFTRHTYANGWAGLKLGQSIIIRLNSREYIKIAIAGFNCEIATDGIPGGIAFILIDSSIYLDEEHNTALRYQWYSNNEAAPYINSDIHSWLNSTIYNNLYNILGNHIVQRNVTLGSACSTTKSPRYGTTTATTNTTAYLTLPSAYQLGFTESSYNNSMDDGEANYKLPVFDYLSFTYLSDDISYYWLRNVYGSDSNTTAAKKFNAYVLDPGSPRTYDYTDSIAEYLFTNDANVTFVMYLR